MRIYLKFYITNIIVYCRISLYLFYFLLFRNYEIQIFKKHYQHQPIFVREILSMKILLLCNSRLSNHSLVINTLFSHHFKYGNFFFSGLVGIGHWNQKIKTRPFKGIVLREYNTQTGENVSNVERTTATGSSGTVRECICIY
jgi:hypothetical protein